MEREREFSIAGPVWMEVGKIATMAASLPGSLLLTAERCEGRKIFRSNSCRVGRDIDKVAVLRPSRTVHSTDGRG